MADLVTGGNGYFGSVLVKTLCENNHSVRIFDLYDAPDRFVGTEFIQGDIRDFAKVKQACESMQVVYHNIALVPLAKNAKAFWEVNYEGTRNLLQACLETGVKKVIHTSSSAVFGIPEKNPIDRTVQPHPREEYGKAKLAAEKLCEEYIKKGLDITIIRPRTIMGHGRLGIMQILFDWIREGKNVPVLGKGDNLYQFIHSDDLAMACIKAAEKTGPSVFNIGAEQFCTMRETLQGLIAHAHSKSKIVSVPMAPAVALMKITSALGLSPLGPYHALMYGRSCYFDISREKKELNWMPKYGNIEMFCESYDWYCKNRETLSTKKGGSIHRSPVKKGILHLVSKILGWTK